jgi:predicted metalloprotease
MLWRGGRRSDNIEDRRGAGGFSGGGLGGLGGGGVGGGRTVGIGGGIGLLVIVVVAMLFGVDPSALLQGVDSGTGGTYSEQDAGTIGSSPNDDEMKQFVATVLGDTEDTWTGIFKDMGQTYQDPRLVLFSGQVQSACGNAGAAVGPFYCPGDSKVYIDLSFYDELRQRFQAPGDFAQAYVIAHEVGHHVQHLLGITDQVDQKLGSLSQSQANAVSVMVELQADCFAGVWAYHTAQQGDAAHHIVIEEGDVEEALNAATAIGDDKLQEEAQGRVVPDSFTHGSSAQRVRWFKTGLSSGDINACNTFGAKQL